MSKEEEVRRFLEEFVAILQARPDLDEGGGVLLCPAQHHFGVMEENAGDLDLDSMAAKEPGNGWGSKVLQIVVDLADRHGLKIYLRAHADSEDDDTLPDMQGALEAFYARFGFIDTGSWGARDMLRRPIAPSLETEARLATATIQPDAPTL